MTSDSIEVGPKPSFIPNILQQHILQDMGLRTGVKSLKPAHGPSYRSPKTTAFFCRIETKCDKSSKLPLRMRLGTLDYVNTIEGKGPDIKPAGQQ
jgi:hypothetical protein